MHQILLLTILYWSRNIICVPSVKILCYVTEKLNGNTGLNNCSYLRLRISHLNEFERTVVLIIDSIYVAKRVEYSGGEIKGLIPDR